jgi:AcrR family transcriptional regulator
MPARDALLEAAQALLWERGFSAMSPRDVLRRSGAGQGSFYHFFEGKEALAAEAMQAVAEEVSKRVELTCGAGTGSGLERIERFLLSDREALRGCRLGRLAQEPELPESIRESVAAGLDRLHAVLECAVRDAQSEGALPHELDARALAECLIAVVQGGYVLSRAHQSAARMKRVTGALLSVLTRLTPGPAPAEPEGRLTQRRRSPAKRRTRKEHHAPPKSRV